MIRTEMSASDCYQMGVQLFKNRRFHYASQWFNETFKRIQSANTTDDLLTIDTLRYIVECHAEQRTKKKWCQIIRIFLSSEYNFTEDFDLALEVTNIILTIRPNDANATDDKEVFLEEIQDGYDSITEYDRKLDEEIEQNVTKFDNPMEHIVDPLSYDEYQKKLYETLCRNGIVESPIKLAPLRCRYNSNATAFLIIAPLKYEEISLDPYIVVYHEVIYDNEIEVIKNMSIFRVT